jgi:hypothetical protein
LFIIIQANSVIWPPYLQQVIDAGAILGGEVVCGVRPVVVDDELVLVASWIHLPVT